MARPTKVVVTVRDSDDETTSFSFNLLSSINTIAGIETAAQAVCEAAQACITGTIEGASISYPLDITGWALTPSPDGEDTDRLIAGRYVGRTAEGFKAEINLPTFDLTKVNTGTRNVDQTDGDIDTFLTAIHSQSVCTSQDVDLVDVVSFVETYGGKSR